MKLLRLIVLLAGLACLGATHGDHTGGLASVLQQNPKVKIYAPLETGSFGTPPSPPAAKALLRNAAGITPDLRYFNGTPPDNLAIGSPWPGAKFTLIDKSLEIAPSTKATSK